ncbi:MAG: hypothetical protein H7331_07715 [Bacteroidia bacterium]|nr:hypothetical protein [Bacteroidia bacterium]
MMKLSTPIKNDKPISKFKRALAVYLAISILFNAVYPTAAWALTGGPSQPEVEAFTPVGTSDMVDLFSGDFNYNIPLLDVDGYPINIAYHSGITMDQEASWVGLGWNINPGVINRNMRGLPDDFNGDIVEKELNMKPNRTFGVSKGKGFELSGIPLKKLKKLNKGKLGFSKSTGVKYNNYTGIGVERIKNLSISAANGSKSEKTKELGLSFSLKSSSDEGLTLSPSLSYSGKVGKADDQTKLGASVGTSINSRSGLKALTVSASMGSAMSKTKTKNDKDGNAISAKTKGIGDGVNVGTSFDFGMPCYTPNVTMPMHNISISGKFKLGTELVFANLSKDYGAYYSCQRLAQTTIVNPAYGYMHADEGVNYDNALLDFNREKDGGYSKSTKALPLTNFTYDIYTVSGQGAGGSYRPFRSDMGHVFDASASNTSDAISIGAELAAGNIGHAGVDIAVNDVQTHSGRWKKDNDNRAAKVLVHKGNTDGDLYESYYFKEANEKSVDSDPAFFDKVGNFDAKSIELTEEGNPILANAKYKEGGNFPLTGSNIRTKRQVRDQNISILNKGKYSNFAIDPTLYSQINNNAKDHHISEITSLGNDGSRYVYGMPAYNTLQHEVTFAVGTNINGSNARNYSLNTGLVDFIDGIDNSVNNSSGIDNFYSNTKMPAYAHSYLLTSILSTDYVDSDGANGPTDGDLGNYTKFNYKKISNYKWRVPFESNKATHNEGLKSLAYDDKANYLYGEKELCYLEKIETKNYIAIFETEARKDAFGVVGKQGGLDSDINKASRLLRKISLYSKPDYKANGNNAMPIKEVHFEYDYSLCPTVPNNNGVPEIVNGNNINANKGKLTLKKIYFTYQNSNKSRLSPYTFNYDGGNPLYNIKGYDRWGNFKLNTATGSNHWDLNSHLSPAEYSYVEQNKNDADQNIKSWTMTSVILPSGGKIKINYESDDYAYVQNKKAMQMFKVVGIDRNGLGIINVKTGYESVNLNGGESLNTNDPLKLIIKLQKPINTGNLAEDQGQFLSNYLYSDRMDYLYFRFLMKIKKNNNGSNPKFEFVSGYVKRADILETTGLYPGGEYAHIDIKQVNTNDKTGDKISQMTKAAIQYGRLNMSSEIWDNTGITIGENDKLGLSLVKSIVNSSFFKNISDALVGPNQALYNKYYVGQEAVMNKSWVRLFNPNSQKLGGGIRVVKIAMSDEWKGMTANNEDSYEYGQEYQYTNDNGSSSGVASYEPQMGGDENPWKVPEYNTTEKKLLAPDDEQYMEEPFGESFFPSPSIGYSRVIVKNIQRTKVTKHATGKVIHEFYTAKDFPTITKRTDIDPKAEKSPKFSLANLFKINVKDYMTVSQGYVIELNDMHGKPKGEQVYAEGESTPISSVEYKYQKEDYLNGSFKLKNTVTTIDNKGSVNTNARVGVMFDFVSDMREHLTTSISGSLDGNLDNSAVPIPVITVIVIPTFAYERTKFRSSVITKVINRFGILDEVIAKDLGSTVSTKNLAYDPETGHVLLTQTKTNYNDDIYSFTTPAHWYYDGMGPAYKNIGYKASLAFNGGVASVNNAKAYFTEGDELGFDSGAKVWITLVSANSVSGVKQNGDAASTSGIMTILRSGRKNQQAAPMASVTTLNNPLNNISANIYEKVLQASAMEYSNDWRTHCDCFEHTSDVYTTNPFILGTKGYWKTKRSFLHLTNRTQTNANNNTNTRKDGVFSSFTPYYTFGKNNSNKWEIDGKNWTYTAEVTEFSPFGEELESKDALGRYSSAVFGYNQKMPLAVSANSRYKNMAVDNFEDYKFSKCADNHFKFNQNSYVPLVYTQAHTGRTSIKVNASAPVSLQKQLIVCELQGCNLTLNTSVNSSISLTSIVGGTLPYTIEYNILGGSPSVVINNTANKITINSTDYYELEFVVKDSKGCMANTVVKNNGTN